jgi:peptidoglycan/xylan/chitin deacetylase (PgdA/CDA1 family)
MSRSASKIVFVLPLSIASFKYTSAALCFVLILPASRSGAVEVAMTVDDLPLSGQLIRGGDRLAIAEKFISVFAKHHLPPIYEFINGKGVDESVDVATILKKWVDSGNRIGNHTCHHFDLAALKVEDYVHGVRANVPILSNIETSPEFEVSLDFFDYEWINPYVRRKVKYKSEDILRLKKDLR